MCLACNSGLLQFARAGLTRRGVFAAAGALASFSAEGVEARPVDPEAGADVILVGGRILPVDGSGRSAEAMAVRDGRILAVGSRRQVEATRTPASQVVDLAGRVVAPGFVDPHMHSTSVYFDDWLDVGPTAAGDMAGVESRLRRQASQTGSDAWVRAWMFDPSITRGARPIARAWLDDISPHAPLILLESNVHVAYANSRALEVVGITRATRDPSSGRYVRAADGEPTGRLEEAAAFQPFIAKLPQPSSGEMIARLGRLFQHAASKGCTALFDCGVGSLGGVGELGLLRVAMAKDPPVRMGGALVCGHMDEWEAAGVRPNDGDDRFRLRAIKATFDGSNQARTGYQREPYLNGTGRGWANYTPSQLNAIVERAHAAGWQMLVHANGDAAIDVTIDAYQAALAAHPRADHRHRIEHCSVLHPDQMTRMAALGVSPSFLIGHVAFWGRAFRDRILGPERARAYDPCASALAHGLRISLHSDYNVTPIDPLRCMQNAVTRVMEDGGEVLNPGERISARAALSAVTLDAAWQCGGERIHGSLEAGKYADFVILEEDPTRADPSRIGKIAVSETWLEGKKRFG